ncbi:hypothetical protein MMC08_002167 [Hypocenomyce scalaris]|nr:hypothetical protein [Hypocenomyce scalaris]
MIRRTTRPLTPYYCSLFSRHATPQRTLIAAPNPGSGPLMTRRPDRALPPLISSSRRWLRTLPIFLTILAASTLGIFNYQKASSSIVNATLYALRTSPKAREVLGDEIYFASKMPWIWGEMNQLHGRIDIHFGVKGTRGRGTMRFKSMRRTRMGYVSLWRKIVVDEIHADGIKWQFETQEWSLETEDGQVIRLLDEERLDPFKNTALQAGTVAGA